ncbi:N-acetylmuramoyl-L-alanine amidase [Flavimarina sp. Hel_I_48]|uniref:N-acetylmuramoyl-L-alanine amidase n=1 Tax=Flavimarina sp. Hel_I_48 TaxID=1392488 RepID=UPI001F12D9FC|nr:N-acetylmuramoyl-L-alanine amidase [Flavimarina sp. Hel_I_48]
MMNATTGLKIGSKALLMGVFCCLLTACGNPYSKTNRLYKKQARRYAQQLRPLPTNNSLDTSLTYGEYVVGTTNFNLRKPDYLVIHHTAQDSLQETLRTFTLPHKEVSAHYVISDAGKIYHMLNDYYRAWHGGVGQWGNNTDLNSSSIGIELDNDGFEVFSDAQIKSLLALLKDLKVKYKIPAMNFIGHSDIAPSRKVDPNANFPWEKLADEGYGLWYDKDAVDSLQMPPAPLNKSAQQLVDTFPLDMPLTKITFLDRLVFPDVLPADFNYMEALKIVGYDISEPLAAIQGFELHFIQENINGVLDHYDLKVLYNLYKKYL